jgi:radical SAM protein with 4Fe4S-binding SPASM domain
MPRRGAELLNGVLGAVQRRVPPALRDAIYRRSAEFIIATLGLRTPGGPVPDDLGLVHIETRTMCNGQCTFCAAAVQYKARPDDSMSDALFEKITRDLEAMRYRGRISPYCNNEPLLEARMPRFLALLRARCPDATLEIKTNGVLLREETMHTLAETGLDYLFVNDYHTSLRVTERLEDLCRRYPTLGRMRVSYTSRRVDETEGIINRAGTNPLLPALSRPMDVFCVKPFQTLTISVSGDVSTCSNDLFFRNAFGNVAATPLAEVWHGERVRRLRADLLRHRRGAWDACRGCDYRGFDGSGVRGRRLPASSRLFAVLDSQR